MIEAALAMLMAIAAPAQDAPTPGTIVVEQPAGRDLPPAVKQAFADGIERALADARFTALPAGTRGRYIARFAVTRAARGEVASNGREPKASAGSTGNWGVGLAVAMPSNKRQLRGLIVTELTVEIIDRASGERVWTGRALTAQAEGTRTDAPEALAAKLAPAAIGRFPAADDAPVSVP
ncbi:hypothetical protein [Sphingomonas sp.]|uniref:hypothetical protein n=1 Tax=Sphingomonas sp. TaxID=28214 RepID=UPI001EB98FEE|nr:hypothetical protein [Sphingomonas sp.]MBX3593300.1 hypothetical protein [Sphingomonas sp.]